jgi:pre-rRNA-processing protein IPI1
MGSSTRKKREKKKDFQVRLISKTLRPSTNTLQKAKLRVGKTRPKASNFTDTSFKSKGADRSRSTGYWRVANEWSTAIILREQSLATVAPHAASQFSHHLSLLSSRSDGQRRESLAFLTSSVTNRSDGSPLPQPLGVFLPKLFPLILDGSNAVRAQLLKLLEALPREEVADDVEGLLLYVRAGMTHLAPDIRNTSMDILHWAIGGFGAEVVTCPGGWVKTIKCFLVILGWSEGGTNASRAASRVSFGRLGSSGKNLAKVLDVFGEFLQAGLLANSHNPLGETRHSRFPLWYPEQHMLSVLPNDFAHLNLFGLSRDEDGAMYEDREQRQAIYHTRFGGMVERGVEAAKAEGGEVGRAAAALKKVLCESFRGYTPEDSR